MHLSIGDGFALGRLVVVAKHAVAKFHLILGSECTRMEICFSTSKSVQMVASTMLMIEICVYIQQQKHSLL
jgi:hypothetical protein